MASHSPFLPGEPLGWPLLPVPDATGSLSWPNLDASVRQTIRSILMTRKGEWLLARESGVGLAEYLHEPNTAATRRRLRDAIVKQVGQLETRIKLDAVELVAGGERGEEVQITVSYRIKRTGKPSSLAVTMKLGA